MCAVLKYVTLQRNNPGSCSEAYESSSIVFKSGDDIKDSKKYIIYKCAERNNEWAHVEGPVFDLPAADAHYHKKCMYLFISNRSCPNPQTVVLATDYIENTTNIPFMQKNESIGSNGSTIWISIS